MKACAVYKTKKEYKILTSYQVDIGRHVLRNPIFIIPLDIQLHDFKNKIFECLNTSKSISYDEYYSGISPKEVLKMMKESSFNGLYKKSTSCMIYLDDNHIKIVPYIYKGYEQGLIELVENTKIIKIENDNTIQIVAEIENMLSKDYV